MSRIAICHFSRSGLLYRPEESPGPKSPDSSGTGYSATMRCSAQFARLQETSASYRVEGDHGHLRGRDDRLALHWQGRDHTQVEFYKTHTGQHRYVTDHDHVGVIGKLARIEPDTRIASILNKNERSTAHGQRMSARCAIVIQFRTTNSKAHQISGKAIPPAVEIGITRLSIQVAESDQ